jgi:hypothetical protein
MVTSITIVGIRPPFTEHPTPSSHHSITHSIFSINFTNLPINFIRASILAYKNLITDRILQLAGFSIFILISRQNVELINKE